MQDEPLKVKMQRFGVRLESRAVKRKIKRVISPNLDEFILCCDQYYDIVYLSFSPSSQPPREQGEPWP